MWYYLGEQASHPKHWRSFWVNHASFFLLWSSERDLTIILQHESFWVSPPITSNHTKRVTRVLFLLFTLPACGISWVVHTIHRSHFNVHWSRSNLLPAYNVPCPRPKVPQTVYVKALRAVENPATKLSNTRREYPGNSLGAYMEALRLTSVEADSVCKFCRNH